MKRLARFAAIPLSLVFGLMACQNPMTAVKAALAGASGQPPAATADPLSMAGTNYGTLTMKIKPVSTALGALLKMTAKTKSTTSSSKAFLTASKLEFTLYDAAGATVIKTWSQSLSSYATIFDGFNSQGNSFSISAPNQVLPVGTYQLKIALYNPNDLSNPAVSGMTTSSFNVTAGGTTSVSITCFPVAPVTMNFGSVTTSTSLATPWLSTNLGTSSAPVIDTIGSETWYQIYLDSTTNTDVQIAGIPETGSQALLGVFVFNSAGQMVGGGGSTSDSGSMQAGAPATVDVQTTYSGTGTYYVGVMDFGTGTATQRAWHLSATNAPPSGFTLTAADTTYVDLSWYGATGATGFTLQRDTNSSFTAPINIGIGSGLTSYSDTSVTPGSTYYYRILASYTSGGDSPYSRLVVATAAPSPVTQAVSSVNIYNIQQNQFDVSWNSVPLATGYTVNVYSDSAGTAFVTSISTTGNTYGTVSGLAGSTNYWVKVLAFDSVNTTADTPASSLYAVTTATPTAPAQPYLWSSTTTQTSVELDWYYDSNATSYIIYRDTSPTSTPTFLANMTYNNNYYIDSTAVAGTTYYYQIQAVNAYGAGLLSNVVTVSTPAALLYPSGFSVVGSASTATSVTLQWNSYAGATSYSVWYNDSTAGSNGYVGGGSTTALSVIFSGIIENHNYVFWVMANNSSWSNNIDYQRVRYNNTSTVTLSNLYSPYGTGSYNVRWSDGYSGNGTDDVDVAVAMQDSLGNYLFGGPSYYQGGVDSGYLYPQTVPLTAGSTYTITANTWSATASSGTIEVWYEPAQ